MLDKIIELLPSTFPHFSLHDVRLIFAHALQGGAECPCCGRYAKVYHRRIYGAMVAFLVKLTAEYVANPGTCVNVRTVAQKTSLMGGDYAKLLYWDLVERVDEGNWIPTSKGIDFALDKIRVPKYVVLYNAKVLEFSEETVGVRESLGKFDYDELMKR